MKGSSKPNDLLKLALSMHQHLCEANEQIPSFDLRADYWTDLARNARLLKFARCRGWKAAARHLEIEVSVAARSLARYLTRVQELADQDPPPKPFSPRDICRDLQELHEEFDGVRIDRREHRLTVVTERIILEEIDLGRFKIVLRWRDSATPYQYNVVALDPNPADGDSTTTHPHVRDESLCEGDGQEPIRSALRQGRIFDFFVLVRQVLHTYNPRSAYIALAKWHGAECRDCGERMGEEDRVSCERCGHQVCLDCSYYCEGCSISHCSDCQSICTACDHVGCDRCVKPCVDCDQRYCGDCLTDGLCASCLENHLENEPNEDAISPAEDEPLALPEAAIQPSGLG